MTRRPAVSVVIPAFDAAGTIRACLASLERQATRYDAEVIVVASGGDATAEIVASEFAWARLVVHRARLFPGAARNAGIAIAQGDVLAFTDADCVVRGDWLERILAAQARGDIVVGGAIANANPASRVGWAAWLLECTAWAPGRPAADVIEIPTSCLAMPRWVFGAHGPFRAHGDSSDTAFHWRLARAGIRRRFDPSIEVAHVNPGRLATLLAKKVRHGRDFARMRVAEQRFLASRRALYAVLAPLLPLLLWGRIVRLVRPIRALHRPLVRSTPLLLLALAAWAAGEAIGYAWRGVRR